MRTQRRLLDNHLSFSCFAHISACPYWSGRTRVNNRVRMDHNEHITIAITTGFVFTIVTCKLKSQPNHKNSVKDGIIRFDIVVVTIDESLSVRGWSNSADRKLYVHVGLHQCDSYLIVSVCIVTRSKIHHASPQTSALRVGSFIMSEDIYTSICAKTPLLSRLTCVQMWTARPRSVSKAFWKAL